MVCGSECAFDSVCCGNVQPYACDHALSSLWKLLLGSGAIKSSYLVPCRIAKAYCTCTSRNRGVWSDLTVGAQEEEEREREEAERRVREETERVARLEEAAARQRAKEAEVRHQMTAAKAITRRM